MIFWIPLAKFTRWTIRWCLMVLMRLFAFKKLLSYKTFTISMTIMTTMKFYRNENFLTLGAVHIVARVALSQENHPRRCALSAVVDRVR